MACPCGSRGHEPGRLHALALSLFFPRATMDESPFRFVVVDDPVQSMDPAKVDGLARVLEEAAATRQVVVFTYDDRLPEAVRRLGIDATILEVSREKARRLSSDRRSRRSSGTSRTPAPWFTRRICRTRSRAASFQASVGWRSKPAASKRRGDVESGAASRMRRSKTRSARSRGSQASRRSHSSTIRHAGVRC